MGGDILLGGGRALSVEDYFLLYHYLILFDYLKEGRGCIS